MTISDNADIDRTIDLLGGITTCSLPYSPRLARVMVQSDFYDMLKAVAETAVDNGDYDFRPSTAAEEHHIYSQQSTRAKWLSDIDEFKDYFGKGDGTTHWCITLTGLRVPKGCINKTYKIGEKIPVQVIVTDISPFIAQIADPNFSRKDWTYVIKEANKIVGEIKIPYSIGNVIDEIDPYSGIFTEIEKTQKHRKSHKLHAWTKENFNISLDPISGYYDVAVAIRPSWVHPVGGQLCLDIRADVRRWAEYPWDKAYDSFRPVRGPPAYLHLL